MAIYTLVGENTSTFSAVIKQYDSSTDTWSTVVDVVNPITDGINTMGGLYSVHGTSDGQFMIATGYCSPGPSAGAAISSDGGLTWSFGGVVYSTAGTDIAYSVQVVSPTEAYCCTNNNRIYKWNGSTWSLWIIINFPFLNWDLSVIKVINGYVYVGASGNQVGTPSLFRIPTSIASPTMSDIESDSSFDIAGTTLGVVDIQIDSDGVFYLTEKITSTIMRCRVWRGTWNNFAIDYDGIEGVNDRAPYNLGVWGTYTIEGFHQLYISPEKNVYWTFHNSNDSRYVWIARRDFLTGTWSSQLFVASRSYQVSSIIGSADTDIFCIAGQIYWWDGGPGYYQKYNGTNWSLEQDSSYSLGGMVFGMFAMFTAPPPTDPNPPYIQNEEPEDSNTNIARYVKPYLEIVDDESNVNLANTVITIESETAYDGSSFISPYDGPLSVVDIVEGVPSGYSFTFDKESGYESLQTVNINVSSEDLNGNALVSGYSFQIEFYDNAYGDLGQQVNVIIVDQYLRHQLQISHGAEFIGVPSPGFAWNQFDEFALIAGLKRLYNEPNYSLKRRTINTFIDRANSTYRGLINGITRELGLSLYYPLTINPKRSPYTGKFYASDPYIKFDAAYLYLYSDYANSVLDHKLDRFEKGGNYEHLTRLVDFINSTTYFEASINFSYDPYIKSLSIINQSNRELVSSDIINSTKVNLSKQFIVKNSVLFNNAEIFRHEKNYLIDVTSYGDYHIDYHKGIVTTYSQPPVGTALRYKYTVFPFKPVASDIIVHDLNNENFKIKMFNQVLQDDGSYIHGLPTELGADIINELMSVSPMYYGI